MDKIAKIIDRLDNIVAAMSMPTPADIHLKALRQSIPEVKHELKEAYLELGGEDHWA